MTKRQIIDYRAGGRESSQLGFSRNVEGHVVGIIPECAVLFALGGVSVHSRLEQSPVFSRGLPYFYFKRKSLFILI
jgi:hypothetical protein